MTRSELTALAFAAYCLDDADRKRLQEIILAASLAALKASYHHGARIVGSTSTAPDSSDELSTHAASWAASIVATYNASLRLNIDSFLSSWVAAHETIDGAVQGLIGFLRHWTQQRVAWKSDQIAQAAVATGADAGTEQFVSDLLTAPAGTDEASPNAPDEDSPLDLSNVFITVLPEESSHDSCSQYAGELFSLDEYDDLPYFPMHPGCPHFRTICSN